MYLLTLYENILSNFVVLSYQLKLIKMRAKLANLNHYAVLFLNRAAVNLTRYYSTFYIVQYLISCCQDISDVPKVNSNFNF